MAVACIFSDAAPANLLTMKDAAIESMWKDSLQPRSSEEAARLVRLSARALPRGAMYTPLCGPRRRRYYTVLLQLALMLMLFQSTCYCESDKGVEWGRFRFWPKVTLSEEYTDNFFLTPDALKDEFITTISPAFGLDFAIAPENIVSLLYEGDYRTFAHFDNMRNDYHRPSITWLWTQPRGSFIKLKGSQDYNAFRPSSEDDTLNRDYVHTTAAAQTLIKAGELLDVDLNYSHDSRSFDNDDFAVDEFERNTFSIALGYTRFNFGTPLLQYGYSLQDNNDVVGPSTDFTTHTAMLGVKWDPDRRLTGALKMGYLMAEFEDGESFSGYTLDSDLTYHLTGITDLKLKGLRSVTRSTLAARETGDFYTATGFRLSAVYRRFELITVTPELAYTNKDFSFSGDTGEGRTDDLYEAGLEVRYAFRSWLAATVRYHYRRNDSTVFEEDFTENLVTLGLTASM